MYNILIILIVIAAILLALIVLIQESKGGGLASGFASSNAIMGVRRTTDIIEKTTWGLAIAIVVLSVCAAYVVPTSQDVSVVMKQNNALPTVPAQQVPMGNQGTAAPQQQAPAQEAPATPAN